MPDPLKNLRRVGIELQGLLEASLSLADSAHLVEKKVVVGVVEALSDSTDLLKGRPRFLKASCLRVRDPEVIKV